MKMTAESVFDGHPDKVCDQISDAILDAYLQEDPEARVAIECLISNNLLVISGEVRSTTKINCKRIAMEVLKELGYNSSESGFDADSAIYIENIHSQSEDIALGVDNSMDETFDTGAGDQGTMYGYATDETSDFIPAPLYYAHKIAKYISGLRHSGELPVLLPDGKCQVTVEYDDNGNVVRISDVIVSCQNDGSQSNESLSATIKRLLIENLLPTNLVDDRTRYCINPTGKFTIGGPQADTGLTGRKIIVDTYGGAIPHGGGAFSGKDPTKVDRSASYMARYIAKNIVASGLAKRCQVSLSYAIGYSNPIAVDIDCFSTNVMPLPVITQVITLLLDLTPSEIIKHLDLRKVRYRETAVFGHFRDNSNFTWEQTNLTQSLNEIKKTLEKII